MKLIVDNTNIETIPVGNLMDIGGMLRALADDIDAGQHGGLVSVISLIVRDDGIGVVTYGENCSHYELMGLFEAAKLRVFADDVIED